MGGKVGENPAALRAAVFSLASKNLRGGGVQTPPPSRARVKIIHQSLRLVTSSTLVFFREVLAQSVAKRHEGLYRTPPTCAVENDQSDLAARFNPYKVVVDSGVGVDSGGSESEWESTGKS